MKYQKPFGDLVIPNPHLRHHFIRLSRSVDVSAIEIQAQYADILDSWLKNQLPVIRTRRYSDTQSDEIDLGLALPPSLGKSRISFRVKQDWIEDELPPVCLADLLSTRSDQGRDFLIDLNNDAKKIGIRFQIYGSFAWEYFTKLKYVTDDSDIDLCWRTQSQEQLFAGLKLLKEYSDTETIFKHRLDGEVILLKNKIDWGAVSWREFLTDSSQVLVKTSAEPVIMGIEEILSTCLI